jgi:thiol-disulfide isomerase/thioredoxin
MPKTVLLFALSLAVATSAGGVIETISPAGAQVRVPLLGIPRPAPRPAPAWRNKSWLNTDKPLTLESQRGRVVLLNFWVFTCYNCTNTVPSLVDLDHKYRDQGLTIIGVHTPEFPPYSGEHDKANVQRALERYHIEYPVAQDNDTKTWDLYGIRFWPSFVLIDKQGRIRYEGAGEFHVGDEHYQYWEGKINELLAEQ